MLDRNTVRIRLAAPPAGADVPLVLESMVGTVDRLGLPAVCSLNGIDVTAFPGDSVAEVQRQFEDSRRFSRNLERAMSAGRGETY